MDDTLNQGNSKLLDVGEVAEVLHHSPRTIREMLNDGRIQGSRFGPRGKWLISETEVQRAYKEIQNTGRITQQQQTDPLIPDAERKLSKESEVVADYNKDLARQHDISIFKKSEEIMNEQKVIGHMKKLHTPDWSILAKWWPETDHYLYYFSLPGNQYVDHNLARQCEKWLDALHKLESLAARHFYIEGERYVFMPVGYQHYIDSTDEDKQAFRELESLASKALKIYVRYRKAIITILYV